MNVQKPMKKSIVKNETLEELKTTNKDLIRLLCAIRDRVDMDGGFDRGDYCAYQELKKVTANKSSKG